MAKRLSGFGIKTKHGYWGVSMNQINILNQCIKNAGCTIAEFAKINGFKKRTLENYLYGERNLKADKLLALMVKYGVSVKGE